MWGGNFILPLESFVWVIELGQADIYVEVLMMSSHLALPHVGHLKEVFHMFAYLRTHQNIEMVFDLTVEFDRNLFERQDWSFSPYGYDGLSETLPDGIPTLMAHH